MPTQTKENYLKAIYFLEQEHQEVTITRLGETMEVSKPTVNNMIKKLASQGWVHYEKYKPIQFTEEGKKKSALIIRKHRLTEMFLVEIMGFGWEEVHDIAEEMEHLKAEALFERMDEMLGAPKVDPHGSPIPNKGGELNTFDFPSLSEFGVGKKVELKAVRGSSNNLLKLLNAKEIQLGTTFKVLNVESFDRSMVVSYGKYQEVTLSYEVCRSLLVEQVD